MSRPADLHPTLRSTGTTRAVFIDKDGTLIENVPYNVDVALIRFAPTAGEALRLLAGAGYQLHIVTNQSGVAEGYFPESALTAVESHLRRRLEEMGVPLRGFFYCPHAAHHASCRCRKPEPGLILEAAQRYDIDLLASWFIGDILTDVEAGNRAGCRSLLVDPGAPALAQDLPPESRPYAVCRDLLEAANVILQSGDPK